jgi:nucleoid DNA-binding protein
MTKQQLIEAVAAKTSHGKTEVESVLDAVLDTIAERLHGSERIDLRGFCIIATRLATTTPRPTPMRQLSSVRWHRLLGTAR